MASQNVDERGMNPSLNPQRLYARKTQAMDHAQGILDKSAWTLLDDGNKKLITDACRAKIDGVLRPLVDELESRQKVDYDSLAKDITKKVFDENLSLFHFEENNYKESVVSELFDIKK
ncbi:hypothetical protein PG999_011795 [Apiospora kogelbergensis]|uniref:Uncharacterized protein n=1 Tax=Apiospora kogelbergensis TaxID=1337665 RepID=A0AAW0QPR0_9PEZI